MEMQKLIPCVLLFVLIAVRITENKNVDDGGILSRHKRYLVFPEGASLTVAFCMTAQTGLTADAQIFSEGINWGIAYDLPNDTKQFKEFKQKTRKEMQRRHRRDLYTKLETIMDSIEVEFVLGPKGKKHNCADGNFYSEKSTANTTCWKCSQWRPSCNIMQGMGYDGRNCILRALCETSRSLTSRGESLLEEILHIVFGYPKEQDLTLNSTEAHHNYLTASEKGRNRSEQRCFEIFPGCPFSVLDLALGYYSSYADDPSSVYST